MNSVNEYNFGDTEATAFDEKADLLRYWYVILQRRWIVITAFLLSTIICLVYLKQATRIYQAVAQLQLEQDSGIINFKDILSIDTSQEIFIPTQSKKLLSKSLLNSVLKDLNWQDKRLPEVDVEPLKSTKLVLLKVEHTDPEKAALVVNKLAEAFIQTNLLQKYNASMVAVVMLTKQAELQERKVLDAEHAVQEYQRKFTTMSFETGDLIFSQSLNKLQTELTQAQFEALASQTALEAVEKVSKDGSDSQVLAVLATNQVIIQLNQKLSESEINLQNLLLKYKNKHPSVIEARNRIKDQKKYLQEVASSEINKMLTVDRLGADNAKDKVSNIQKLLDGWRFQQGKFLDAKIEYDALHRAANNAKVLYDNLQNRIKEAEVLAQTRTNPFSVIEPARVPGSPIKPRILPTLFLGVIGSLAAAVGLAFLLDFFDNTVKSQEDVEQYLRQKFLSYIPKVQAEPGMDPRLHTHFLPQTIASESFRSLRAALSLAYKAEQLQILTITSTVPAEGKSFVASNLAIVTAQTGLKTLLVDADFRRPTLDQMFNYPYGVGLISYLSGKIQNLDQVIHATDVPNLDVICTGGVSSSPAELVGSNSMVEFLREVRKRYDRIILDSPPVSAVSDPLLLAAMSDGVVFVTRFNKIGRAQVRRCLQQIQEARIPICGVVSNYVDFEGKDRYYAFQNYDNHYYQTYKKSPAKADLALEQGA